jgi:hypothetical protein
MLTFSTAATYPCHSVPHNYTAVPEALQAQIPLVTLTVVPKAMSLSSLTH